MQFGNLSGLVNGTEQIVFDYEVTGSSVSSISTGSILNGNEDVWYTILIRSIGSGANGTVYIQPNGDTGNNMGLRGWYASSGTIVNQTGSGDNISLRGGDCGSGLNGWAVCKFYAKSGTVRYMNNLIAGYISGASVSNVKGQACVWTDTTNNLTSMTFKHSGANLDVGTRIIILKSNNFSGGTSTGLITTPYIKGAWYRVGSTVLSGTASSITYSSLDGNRDVVYFLSAVVKSSGGGNDCGVTLNADATSGHYGYQQISASGGSVTDANSTTETRFPTMNIASVAGNHAYMGMYIFAKSGFVRPAVQETIHDIATTPAVTRMRMMAHSWTDTATNITSLTLSAGSNNFAIGTQFDLYALRPSA